ncbi:hypothetical protein KY290_018694 [Solanum tuberosum]|uniref:Uncharacterized protein n=1 Tax=Solanum tuberosum TaxID=4113 RepID=A0ABQ7VGS5_SOLTU|nr:hypothetical protein KY290_018694 [Solanum tuberosum]
MMTTHSSQFRERALIPVKNVRSRGYPQNYTTVEVERAGAPTNQLYWEAKRVTMVHSPTALP